MVSDLFGQDDLKEMSDKEGGEVAYFSPPKEICLVVLFCFFFSGGWKGFFFLDTNLAADVAYLYTIDTYIA